MACTTLDDACDVIRKHANRLPRFTLVDRGDGSGKRKRRVCAWRRDLIRLADGLQAGNVPFCVFAKGNSKLPFFSWSTLPEFTCPGAGDCLRWCYSFVAWRNAGPFCRQLQNTLLLRFRKTAIVQAWRLLPANVVVRLYVDGDIDSVSTLGFWFRLLADRPDIQAYGYSKSWEVFERWADQGLPWPSNYKLNLSSGSKYDDDERLRRAVGALPISRGEFVAVEIGKHTKGFARFESAAYHSDVRDRARSSYGTQRVFSCPGQCGSCLPNGEHACGSDKFDGVLIAIGEHN